MTQNEQLAQLQAIFHHLPDGIITVDMSDDHRLTQINRTARAILPNPDADVKGVPFADVFTAGLQPLTKMVREICTTKRGITNLTVEIKVGETAKTFLVNATILPGNPAHPATVLLILRDLSLTGQNKSGYTPRLFEKLVGTTPTMQNVFSTIETIAPTDAAVLIYGETGTGKELVARAIHRRSDRADEPFITVNCSAIPSPLLESHLFGHTKGAFTGAIKSKPGRFELADGGTIFLDEIATLTQEIQVSLLRVLQEKTIERIGGTNAIHVDVRIISATNRQLPELIRQNLFRKDLYYRIKVLQINLPPLRRRKPDIKMLAEHFVAKYGEHHGCKILGISAPAMRALRQYQWPGNVRELENAIEHAVILAQYGVIEPIHLPREILAPLGKGSSRDGDQVLAVVDEPAKIKGALRQTGGNVSRAAKLLGIHRTTLWRKMRELRIDRLPGGLSGQ